MVSCFFAVLKGGLRPNLSARAIRDLIDVLRLLSLETAIIIGNELSHQSQLYFYQLIVN